MELTIDSPVRYIPRVGPAVASRLEILGIHTVLDLLTYPPHRYDDYSLVTEIGRVQPGETVSVRGQMVSLKNFVTKSGKRIQEGKIADSTGEIAVIWFNQPFLARIIPPPTTVYLAGKADWFGRKIALISPQYEPATGNRETSLHTGRLVPVYPETAGLTSKWLRAKIDFLLKNGPALPPDALPEALRETYQLVDFRTAIRNLHYPASSETAATAKHRLAFEELFYLGLASHERRREWEASRKAEPAVISDLDAAGFRTALPFTLTCDQETAIGEIRADMAKNIPMNRLLVGDVGSGKTAVAAAGIYTAFRNGRSSALMAPTQILAEQHFATLRQMFQPLGIEVTLVTAKSKPSAGNLISGPPVWVGTHALLSESVSIDNLGLIVIDEQQRFGVRQRLHLREKGPSGTTPHLLTMTATPIPRTVALTIFGSLDISTLNEKPAGRLPVKTWVVPPVKRDAAYAWIRRLVRGEQSRVFVICPLIEDADGKSEIKAAKNEFDRLSHEVFPDLKLGLIHGRLKAGEKTRILNDFRSGTVSLLVATPVVEVGIDIPDARVILIEAADRFGLSQLHQLRGRVGRNNFQSYCLLFTDSTEKDTLKRLKTLESVHSGPLLAEVDLALRGPGELFGTRQHGLPRLRYASFMDVTLLAETSSAAKKFVSDHSSLEQFPLLRQRLKTITIDGKPQD
jgi:ATP-dependent DNA helicase RecG